MPPTPGALHHVEIYVSDLARTLAFWEWFLGGLGYECISRWDAGASFELGPTYLVFVQAEARHLDVPYHRCRAGLNHLAFHARDRAHVDEVTDALRTRNVPILYEDRHPFAGGPDYYAVFFEDPDRIKVELVAPG
jgi:catechol 2,3-dioxygenase-like lactoylglutathione lyase family enzyme